MSDRHPAPMEDVVVSSRVRLARNYRDIPFPSMLTREYADEVIHRSRAALSPEQYELIIMEGTPAPEKAYLTEQGLISGEMGDYTAALISTGKTVSVLINEEDHLRIQAMLPGEQLERCAQVAYQCDDELSRAASFAFDRQLGYLTSSPANAGTGMRASLMLHLPALSTSGQMGEVAQAAGKLGLSLRAVSGQGPSPNRMFYLSNQITLGRSEEDILRSVTDAAQEIVERERLLRASMAQNSVELIDRLMRSLGILSQARLMSEKEWDGRASDLRFAAELGLIHADLLEIDRMRLDLRNTSLLKNADRELPGRAGDRLRAEILREKIKEWGIV